MDFQDLLFTLEHQQIIGHLLCVIFLENRLKNINYPPVSDLIKVLRMLKLHD